MRSVYGSASRPIGGVAVSRIWRGRVWLVWCWCLLIARCSHSTAQICSTCDEGWGACWSERIMAGWEGPMWGNLDNRGPVELHLNGSCPTSLRAESGNLETTKGTRPPLNPNLDPAISASSHTVPLHSRNPTCTVTSLLVAIFGKHDGLNSVKSHSHFWLCTTLQVWLEP